MNKLKIEEKSGVFKLEGIIDEDADFSPLKNNPKKLVLNLKGVERINSSGVREWIRASKDFPPDVEYQECSEPFVEQMNMISNFISKGNVASFFAPYHCSKCANDEMVLLNPAKDFKGKGKTGPVSVPVIKCRTCGQEMILDEDEDEYFLFLWK